VGLGWVAQLLRAGLESSLDYANPQYPAFFRMADETKKMLNDNPDNYYQNCVIDGRYDYRITGTRSTVSWFSLGSKGAAVDVADMIETGNIDSTQLDFNADGSFEILASSEKKPGNWLPLASNSAMILVRQTFGNRNEEEPTKLHIECLNPTDPNNNLTPAALEQGLKNTVHFVRSVGDMTIDWQQRYKKTHLNLLPEDDQVLCRNSGGDPNIHYYQSYWKLADDEALYVHLTDIPECKTWNLQLSNYWMQSLDYRFFRICINKFTAHYEADGSVKIIVANENPGPRYPNWLTTLGHREGGMLGRYVQARNPPRLMDAKVVKLATLRDG
jgi:hypothetical protein